VKWGLQGPKFDSFGQGLTLDLMNAILTSGSTRQRPLSR